jgi:hypothetical protein
MYLGDRLVETEKKNLLRVGSHSRYDLGELRVKPPENNHQKSGVKLDVRN